MADPFAGERYRDGTAEACQRILTEAKAQLRAMLKPNSDPAEVDMITGALDNIDNHVLPEIAEAVERGWHPHDRRG